VNLGIPKFAKQPPIVINRQLWRYLPIPVFEAGIFRLEAIMFNAALKSREESAEEILELVSVEVTLHQGKKEL
jgi:hypothetical protein